MEKKYFDVASKTDKEQQAEFHKGVKRLLQVCMEHEHPKKMMKHVVNKISKEMQDKGFHQPEEDFTDDDGEGDEGDGSVEYEKGDSDYSKSSSDDDD